MTKDYGYLQHGTGTNGPFRTERVSIKTGEWPNANTWYAHYEGRWRKVHMTVNNTWIVYQGKKIYILIEDI